MDMHIGNMRMEGRGRKSVLLILTLTLGLNFDVGVCLPSISAYTQISSPNSLPSDESNSNSSSGGGGLESCSSWPKISIVSYTREGFSPNERVQSELITISVSTEGPAYSSSSASLQGSTIYAPFEAMIEVECESTSPIAWTFEGPNVRAMRNKE